MVLDEKQKLGARTFLLRSCCLVLASEKGILTQHEQRPEVRGLFAQSADGILEVETQRSRQCGCGWSSRKKVLASLLCT